MNRIFLMLLVAFTVCEFPGQSQESIHSVLNSNRGGERLWLRYQDNHRALYSIICDAAFSQLEAREKRIAAFTTKKDWLKHQKEVRNVLCSPLEKFTRTPLHPRITGVIERETFRVEKIWFASHPGFFVTGCLFIPHKRQAPAPAVIYCSGHTASGFRSETYQQVILNLVDKGFIVFAFDPIGQGERLQYVDPGSGQSKAGGPTTEHSYAGVQVLLSGASLSDYFIWDGIRAIDYLETRPEVDMSRIGITGRSGGGTQSALIAACDRRVYAAAPECYITSFKRLLQSIGPQDAEQNPWQAIHQGLDHPDFLHVRAPRPTLIVTTTNDFFSIQGARETFAEAQKSYKAFGKPENIEMAESFGKHESTRENREAVYAFFQKHLNIPGDPSDAAVETFRPEDLLVTPAGLVQTSFDGKTVFDLNKSYFPGKRVPEKNLRRRVKKTAGINFSLQLSAAVYTGRFSAGDIRVGKYFLENDRMDFALPLFTMKAEGTAIKNILFWLHPEGKEALLSSPWLPEFVERGYCIVSCDLPGTGELHDPGFVGDGFVKGVPFNYTFGANLAGISIPGIQAEAIDLAMQFISQNPDFQGLETDALAEGVMAAAFLHFAALKNSFRRMVFYRFPAPGEGLLSTEYYSPEKAYHVVPGSLLYYDLPDLKGLLPKGSVLTLPAEKMAGENYGSENFSEIARFLKEEL